MLRVFVTVSHIHPCLIFAAKPTLSVESHEDLSRLQPYEITSARVFVTVSHIHPCLTLAGKARSLPLARSPMSTSLDSSPIILYWQECLSLSVTFTLVKYLQEGTGDLLGKNAIV